jgi:hypothetical protein
MVNLSAVGGTDLDGNPIVKIIAELTVPLGDADDIYKMIRKAGTQAVLALGALHEEAAEATETSQATAPQVEG